MYTHILNQLGGCSSYSTVGLTVALALLLWVRVVEKSLPIVSPGHAAKLDLLQPVLQRLGVFHLQEADLHPV